MTKAKLRPRGDAVDDIEDIVENMMDSLEKIITEITDINCMNPATYSKLAARLRKLADRIDD